MLKGYNFKPKVHIDFDFKNYEYHLIYEEGSNEEIALLRNELTYGARELPISKRDNNFGKPSDEEVFKFRDIAWKSFGIDDVIKKLGKPEMDLLLVIHDAYYDENIIRQICFTNLSPNVVGIFREYESYLITVQYAGKELKTN